MRPWPSRCGRGPAHPDIAQALLDQQRRDRRGGNAFEGFEDCGLVHGCLAQMRPSLSLRAKRSNPARRLALSACGVRIAAHSQTPQKCREETPVNANAAKSETIGFIGLGFMGHGMAKNIVEKGYPLTVLGHRNRKPIEDLVGAARSRPKSAKELAARSSIVFLCVTGSKEVEAIARGARRPEGRPEAGLGRRRLLDLRSQFDARARRRICAARRRLRRCAARPHAEGSLGGQRSTRWSAPATRCSRG